jgi:hypothetical protein
VYVRLLRPPPASSLPPSEGEGQDGGEKLGISAVLMLTPTLPSPIEGEGHAGVCPLPCKTVTYMRGLMAASKAQVGVLYCPSFRALKAYKY